MTHLPPTRRLRRRERARRRRFLAGAILTGLLIAVSVFQLSRTTPPAPAERLAVATTAPLVLTTVALEGDEAADPEGLTYPYSIIKGGAQSAEALQAAMDADPVVRLHYDNFDVARTRVVRLTQPRVAHVSYRIGNDVFWTRRPLLLKAGETILTDGTHYARTRCGNQIAMAPGAVSPSEPSAEVLNTPLPRVGGVFAAYPLPGGRKGLNTGAGVTSGGGGAMYPGAAFPSGGSLGSRGGAGAAAGGGSASADDPATNNPGSSTPGGALPSTSSPGGGGTSGGLPPHPLPPGGAPDSPPNDSPPDDPDDPGDPGDPGGPHVPSDDIRQIPEPAVLLLVGAGAVAGFRHLRARMRKS